MFDRAGTSRLLAEGDIEVVGRILGSSNNALFVRVTRTCLDPEPDEIIDAVYKPTIGERPLDDFPDGTLSRRATLNVQTHSGDVELRLPRDTGAEFDLHSIDGFVMVALSPKGPVNKPIRGQPQFFGNAGGGAFVVVRSFKGDIRLIGR